MVGRNRFSQLRGTDNSQQVFFTGEYIGSANKSYKMNKGLYGQQKQENPLTKLALNTAFPTWNNMFCTKNARDEFQTNIIIDQVRKSKDCGNINSNIETEKTKDTDNDAQVKAQEGVEAKEIYIKKLKSLGPKYVLRQQFEKTKPEITSDLQVHKISIKQKMKVSGKRNPSHYKTQPKGHYAACYNPRLTVQKARANKPRSFVQKIHASTNGKTLSYLHGVDRKPVNEDLNINKNMYNVESQVPKMILVKPQSDGENGVVQKQNIYSKLNSNFLTIRNTLQNRKETKLRVRSHSEFGNVSNEYYQDLQRKLQSAREKATEHKRLSRENEEPVKRETRDTEIHKTIIGGDAKHLQKLIDIGEDVNELNSDGFPPCHYALLENNYECLALLLLAGADLKSYFENRKINYFN